MWERLSSGRLKIFKSLGNLRAEYRIYRRDEKGRIVKKDDHGLDALRYAIMSGLNLGKPKKVESKEELVYRYGNPDSFKSKPQAWMN